MISEEAVLRLVASGHTAGQIAQMHGVCTKRVSRVLKQLGLAGWPYELRKKKAEALLVYQ